MGERASNSASRMGEAMSRASRPRPAGRIESLFGSKEFFRLWIAQVISATGDWLGLIATIALASRLSEGTEGTAIALVLATRIAPGFFLATAAGLIVDRFNRKRLLLVCDIGRAMVLFTLPFVDTLAGLVLASFMLELFTMIWSPAKEAIVPNIVPKEKLTTANSLNVAAAYGMFPVAAGLAALLAKVAESLSDDDGWVQTLRLNEEGLAFYVDGISFLITALIIWTTAFPVRSREERAKQGEGSWDLGGAWRELSEGWRFIAVNPIVRAVNVGLGVGVIGGGMLVPLGALYVDELIVGDDADFNLMLFALGLGMALGVITASLLQNRINRAAVFPVMLVVAGGALLVASSSPFLSVVVPLIGVVGFAAGPIYVLGFTLLHENVEDDLRGRIFSALLVLVRFCMLFALAIAPLISEGLDTIAERWWDGDVSVLGLTVKVPGVRLTLWLASFTIIGAGLLASWSLRAGSGAYVGGYLADDSPREPEVTGEQP